MSFVSIFAAGPCLLTATDGFGGLGWSGMAGLSSSNTFDDPSNAGETMTLEVDSTGVITLSTSRYLAGYAAGDWLVTVQPATLTATATASGFATDDGANDFALATWADGAQIESLGFPYAPDPYTFAGASSSIGVQVYWS